MLTYGDDLLGATRTGVVLHEDRFSVWSNELGLRMTNARKEAKPLPLPLSEVTFLKRNIWWDEDLGHYVCPISKKTIAKMLVIHSDSTLSEGD